MLIPVSSLDLPELLPYRTMKRPMDHLQQGIFVAEGEKVVKRLLNSGIQIISFLMTPEWQGRVFPDPSSAPANIYVAGADLINTITGFRLHQGIMAVARVPEQRPLDETLNARKRFILVALDGIVHAENVGLILRNCAAFGVDAVLTSETTANPFLRRAVRNSMGAVFQLNVHSMIPFPGTLAKLKSDHGFTIYAAHPAGNQKLHDIRFAEKMIVIFGNEGEGIPPATLSIADIAVSIPMQNRIDSLNVANANAVFLYEAAKQFAAR